MTSSEEYDQRSPTESLFSPLQSSPSTPDTDSFSDTSNDSDTEPYDRPERCVSAPPATSSDEKGPRAPSTTSRGESFPDWCDRCRALSIDFEAACIDHMNTRELENHALLTSNKRMSMELQMAKMDLEALRISSEIQRLEHQITLGQNMQLASQIAELTVYLEQSRAVEKCIRESAERFSHQIGSAAAVFRKNTLDKRRRGTSRYSKTMDTGSTPSVDSHNPTEGRTDVQAPRAIRAF